MLHLIIYIWKKAITTIVMIAFFVFLRSRAKRLLLQRIPSLRRDVKLLVVA